jgi:hypothetical protein
MPAGVGAIPVEPAVDDVAAVADAEPDAEPAPDAAAEPAPDAAAEPDAEPAPDAAAEPDAAPEPAVGAEGGVAITGSPIPARASSALIVAEKPPAEPRAVPLSTTLAPSPPPPPPSVSHAASPAIVAMARRRLTLDQRYQIWATAAGADSRAGEPEAPR